MKTVLAILLIIVGGVIGLSRFANWVTWTPEQWVLYTQGRTLFGVLRWLMYEIIFAVIWGGILYFGVKLL